MNNMVILDPEYSVAISNQEPEWKQIRFRKSIGQLDTRQAKELMYHCKFIDKHLVRSLGPAHYNVNVEMTHKTPLTNSWSLN